MKPANRFQPVVLVIALLALAPLRAPGEAPTPERWTSVIAPGQLDAELADPDLLVIDVRSPDEYAAGHIRGAINIPAEVWRTPSREPGEGLSQNLFTVPGGTLDVRRYEELLGAAGVRNDHRVVVYGNHGGKADGSVPVSVLLKLGHRDVRFLDGVGLEQWKSAGLPLETEPHVLPRSQYRAQATSENLWDLQRVLQHIGDDDVVFFDVRSRAEFDGTDLRGNKRGGHIPGAAWVDYASFLDPKTKTLISPERAQALLDDAGPPRDRHIVLYCQTATRTSIVELILKDLGYDRVAVYDASWQEYGNRPDTPIESPR